MQLIEHASRHDADLIVFPELSITGYEPEIAAEFATTVDAEMFGPFQQLADANGLCICAGMPTSGESGTHISMLIFQPNHRRNVYSKQLLHVDELPYFVPGNERGILSIKGLRIGLGICYESLQLEHFLDAVNANVGLYLASVAKPQRGIEKADRYFSEISREFGVPVAMSNCVDFCDNFLSTGQSSIWDAQGRLVDRLNQTSPGFLIHELGSSEAFNSQIKIEKGQPSDLDAVFANFMKAKAELDRSGIFQWFDGYPTRSIVERDLGSGVMYVLKDGGDIVGGITISEEYDEEYDQVDWKFDDRKVLIIHRLVISPDHQRRGHARRLMNFAEDQAQREGYSSIRLDTYSKNQRAIDFYLKRGYRIRGDVRFPEREHPFHCMEKEITPLDQN